MKEYIKIDLISFIYISTSSSMAILITRCSKLIWFWNRLRIWNRHNKNIPFNLHSTIYYNVFIEKFILNRCSLCLHKDSGWKFTEFSILLQLSYRDLIIETDAANRKSETLIHKTNKWERIQWIVESYGIPRRHCKQFILMKMETIKFSVSN